MLIALIGLIMIAIACSMCGYSQGWVNAHKEVAKECKQFGFFHVGDELFKCVAVETKPVFGDKIDVKEDTV